MFKKKVSYLLTSIIILNSTLISFAEINLDSFKTHGSITQNISNKNKVSKDLKYLKKCSQDINLIYKIDEKKGLNVYYFKYGNGVIDKVTVSKKNNTYKLDIHEGSIHNTLTVSEKEIYLDGKKMADVKISKESINNTNTQNKKLKNSSMISSADRYAWTTTTILPVGKPTADRDIWTTTKVPYGKSSSYTVPAGVSYNLEIRLNNHLENITVGALACLLLMKAGIKLGLFSSSTVSTIAVEIKSCFSKKTYGLSCKNYKYFHKKGHYIKSKKMYITKNKVRWYSKPLFKGKSIVKTTYTCQKLY